MTKIAWPVAQIQNAALRNFAIKAGDELKVYLTGRGVEAESINTEKFQVTHQMKDFVAAGGKILACGTCLKIRGTDQTELYPLSSQ